MTAWSTRSLVRMYLDHAGNPESGSVDWYDDDGKPTESLVLTCGPFDTADEFFDLLVSQKPKRRVDKLPLFSE